VSTQIGAPVRIVGLVGVVAALALAGWAFLLNGRSETSSTGDHATSAQHQIAAAQSVAARLSAHNKATAAGKPDVVQPSKPKPAAVTHARNVKPAATKGSSPATIASVLRHHRVAVVLLYDPQTKVDSFSLREAQLGALRAHAGFLRVNVLKDRQTAPFAKTYGALRAPTVLFFARPGKLVQKLVGFADQDTVAQAALNAARGLVVSPG
jgi:hypothetical protein